MVAQRLRAQPLQTRYVWAQQSLTCNGLFVAAPGLGDACSAIDDDGHRAPREEALGDTWCRTPPRWRKMAVQPPRLVPAVTDQDSVCLVVEGNSGRVVARPSRWAGPRRTHPRTREPRGANYQQRQCRGLIVIGQRRMGSS